ncbi:MAG TPA: AsmA-like C-terminal region-containing protein [Methyloceanibacter sp.]
MPTDHPHETPAPQAQHKAPPPKPRAGTPADSAKWSPRTRLLLIVGSTVIGVAVLALIIVNLLVSADWVRDRVASHIKEQTGRVLEVKGTTSLLFVPGPRVVITDATFVDPEARAGTADFSVGRLVLDLSLMELLSRQVDAERVLLERPVLTVRLGDGDQPKPDKPKTQSVAKEPNDKPQRDVRLRDVRVEDGTVNIVYDEKGTEKHIEHIAANFSLPTLAEPLTGQGKFDWKGEAVDFNLELTTVGDLREKRPAKLVLALDMPAIAVRFDGSVVTRPEFSGEGELSAKAHSIPSLLAWMREKPTAASAIGDGELASHLAWKKDEITFSNARFALEHASGQGQAVVTLQSPRPHLRAAFALDSLDLNPFLSSAKADAPGDKAKPQASGPSPPPAAETAVPREAPSAEASPQGAEAQNDAPSGNPGAEATSPEIQAAAPAPDALASQGTPPVAPAPAPVASPAAFDADVNLNVRKTRMAHLELGASSLGLVFRDGVLNATLGGMDLYDGHAAGKFVFDASKPVPEFTGDVRLEGVQAKTLLSDAAQFSMLEGRTKLALQIAGSGTNSDEIMSSLQGQGSLAVSDGAIDGVNLTEMISQLGEGQIPEMLQGPGNKTAFSDLGGAFTVKNGIAETSNLQMTSPLLKVAAAGSVDLTQSTINMLATPEIAAGPEVKGGANALAGLSVPVRIEGPLERPTIKPEIKGMFANPEKAGKTINQIGDALQKKFKGKPVGEAIGRFLGNVQIVPRNGKGSDDVEPQSNKQRSDKKDNPQAQPAPEAGAAEQGDSDGTGDPDLDRILR